MTYTHTPKYIYVIIAEQFVITNLSGRTSVRTLHVDCVVSASSPAHAVGHGHGVRSLQSQGTVTVTVPKSCYSLLGSIFFPNHASMLSLSA
jgi:hypothetical protein